MTSHLKFSSTLFCFFLATFVVACKDQPVVDDSTSTISGTSTTRTVESYEQVDSHWVEVEFSDASQARWSLQPWQESEIHNLLEQFHSTPFVLASKGHPMGSGTIWTMGRELYSISLETGQIFQRGLRMFPDADYDINPIHETVLVLATVGDEGNPYTSLVFWDVATNSVLYPGNSASNAAQDPKWSHDGTNVVIRGHSEEFPHTLSTVSYEDGSFSILWAEGDVTIQCPQFDSTDENIYFIGTKIHGKGTSYIYRFGLDEDIAVIIEETEKPDWHVRCDYDYVSDMDSSK